MTVDNVLHGLWIGTRLSKLEQLTLRSFVRHGHEFNLWAYDEILDPLPSAVKLRDATKILPRERIFRKSENDPSAGVGQNSYGPFSDLFRYKLLHDVGGIWIDMDVTCLRPFDFADPYVFRPHTIGVIGNLIKAPRGSELMQRAFEHAEQIADCNVSWLALNRILSRFVFSLRLDNYIKRDIINEGSLNDTIVDYAGSPYRNPPANWYGIHWANEYWSKQLTADAGKGLASKDEPAPGSLLHEFYRLYGLVDPRERYQSPLHTRRLGGFAGKVDDLGRETASDGSRHKNVAAQSVNMLLPTLSRGGAERIVIDIATVLCKDPNLKVNIFVRKRTKTAHSVPERENLNVVYLDRPNGPDLIAIAVLLAGSATPFVFTHLIERRDLAVLWGAGVATIPVIHNSSQGWGETPSGYDHDNVPLVIACADQVRAEVESAGCPAPVVTIRHEVTIAPDAVQLKSGRRKVRDGWGIDDDVLVVGMVGQFKSQKAYTRAVRVLARLQALMPAKLMIVGGWDHAYGAGRVAFEATMRLAVDLGVVADLILIGQVADPVPYFAAFDVFLNTSIFEGASISLMEAVACGCPMVLSAVGGTSEIAPPEAVLVSDPADVDAYVAGILQVASRDVRILPPPRNDPDLVAHIWLGIGKVAGSLARPRYPAANGTLFVTDGLHLDGPTVSLARTLAARRRRARVAIAVLRGMSATALAEDLRGAGIDLVQLHAGASVSRIVDRLIDCLISGNYASVCFWNVQPEVKVLLAKLLLHSRVRLVDVSPGPMLFDELDQTGPFQHRIAFSADQYLARLDHFVALYKGGLPQGPGVPRASSVIPLGVPGPPRFIPLPPPQLMLSQELDPALAIGTVSRLVPYKKVELLLEAMAILQREIPGASLTIVGGPDATSTDYAHALKAKAAELRLQNIHFVGAYADVNRFLAQWRVFVLSGERQGCPNASLEAMAIGLPVVAFASGGLNEQIVNGKTGYLVTTPRQMANRLKLLLGDGARRRRLGEQARERARRNFGLKRSADAFAAILEL